VGWGKSRFGDFKASAVSCVGPFLDYRITPNEEAKREPQPSENYAALC
jgi:hypothetical protein